MYIIYISLYSIDSNIYIFLEHVIRKNKKAIEGPEISNESRKLAVDCLFAIQRT